MTTLKTLFPSLSDMMRYASGIDASNSIEDLTASSLYALKRVNTVVPADIVSLITAIPDTPIAHALCQAVANATMAQHITFQSISLRKSGTDIYKYELESMRRGYNEAYFAGMDTLLSILMSTPAEDDPAKEPITLWQTSRFATMLASCRIKSCEQMDAIYPIDLSYLFFFRTLPLQRESLNERLSAYYAKLPDQTAPVLAASAASSTTPAPQTTPTAAGESATVPGSSAAGQTSTLQQTLDLALVKSTIAKALRRFDPIEFPATMRNLLDDSTATRSAAAEREAAITLAQQMETEVAQLLENIDMLTAPTSPYTTYPPLHHLQLPNRQNNNVPMKTPTTIPISCNGRTYDIPNSWDLVSPRVFLNFVSNLLDHYAGRMSIDEIKLRWLCDAMGWRVSRVINSDALPNALILSQRITCLFTPPQAEKATVPGSFAAGQKPTQQPPTQQPPCPRCQARVVPNLCFARQMLPVVKINSRRYPAYHVESTYDSLTVSLTALQFIEAREQLARGDKALPLLAAILYFPGTYDSQRAQILAQEMSRLPLQTLTAIQMNFIALLNCLFTRTDFSILANFKPSDPSPISTDMADALYDLSSDGLGSSREVEQMNVITYLRILRKKTIEAVRQMRSLEWDVVRISQETRLPIPIIQKIIE
ncbi:MAG: hypothetical protein ACI36Z_00415 [Alloprevotella sp.]